jgi:hypothetical protein
MARAAVPPADFIDDLLLSLARRHKALKHKLRAISVERVADRVEDVERRKLEIIFTNWGSPSAVIEIFAWDDRWISLEVSQSSKSAELCWTYASRGRLIGGLGGRRLVEAAEATIAACYEMTRARLGRFNDIWKPILAAGPQPVA